MLEAPVRQNENRFASLQRLARGAASEKRERCGLCGEGLPFEHRHVLEVATHQITCVCRACSILFSSPAAGGVIRHLIPERAKRLLYFQITDREWQQMRLPVNLAFFFQSSSASRVVGLYPSPAGATEADLELESWDEIVGRNPVLSSMAPDVEALLVNRVRSARDYYVAPIDVCFKLVGLLRLKWRGLGGGTQVWEEINEFFDDLKERSIAIGEGNA